MSELYCDESIWIPVAEGLRRRGWTVYTAREEELLGVSDENQLTHAVENNWTLVTFDDDFLSLVERDNLEHAGIIYVQQAGRDIGDIVKSIDAHLETRDLDDGSIHYC